MLILAKGDLLLVQGKQPEAEAQFQRALELDADNDALDDKLGKYFLATQKWKEAEEVYQKLGNQKPESESLKSYEGSFIASLGEPLKPWRISKKPSN